MLGRGLLELLLLVAVSSSALSLLSSFTTSLTPFSTLLLLLLLELGGLVISSLNSAKLIFLLPVLIRTLFHGTCSPRCFIGETHRLDYLFQGLFIL